MRYIDSDQTMSKTELPTQDQLIADLVNEIIITGDDFSIQYRIDPNSNLILEQVLLSSEEAFHVIGKYTKGRIYLTPSYSRRLADEDRALSKEITTIITNLLTSITSLDQIELCTYIEDFQLLLTSS